MYDHFEFMAELIIGLLRRHESLRGEGNPVGLRFGHRPDPRGLHLHKKPRLFQGFDEGAQRMYGGLASRKNDMLSLARLGLGH
jgi:hypothetical protein